MGDSLLVAPVLEKGARGRTIYLPAPMTEVCWSGGRFCTQHVPAGERSVEVPLGEVVFYIREGKLLPVGRGGSCTAEVDLADVELLGGGTEYAQYIDDGSTRAVSLQNVRILRR